jgi:hypothetical protein
MSSSILSTQNAPTQRVPAWKRLGLKLRAASDNQSESPAAAFQSTPSRPVSAPNPESSTPAKRKPSAALGPDHSAKKAKKENPNTPTTQSQQLKKRKSVSFTAEGENSTSPAPKTNGTSTKTNTTPKKQKSVNLEPAIHYLRQWHTERDQWKFNKNYQGKLLENAFSNETSIPPVDINIFYEYIKPLKGFVRQRLREMAANIIKEDVEQGSKGFSSSSKEVAQRKQKEYEEIIAGFLREGRTPEKRRFEEVEYVLRTTDMEMQRRVVKRMRAEMVMEELSGGEESETTASTTTATLVEAETDTEPGEGSSRGVPAEAEGDKRVKLNDGTQRRINPRKAKARTTAVEEESSSSESESESETSSSESSSEDSEDEEVEANVAPNDAETSSSSSSSSSEESDSEEEDGSGEDDNEEE